MGLVESDSMEPVAARPPTSVHLGPPRPVHYAIKRQVVQTAWASRAVKAGAATAMLFASGRAAGASVELLQMQGAVAKQLHELGQTWVTGLSAWTRECTELRAANTMSKIVEQEFDLIGQFGQLVTDQATALVNLMEGVQVGYGYWVQEKLDR
jgi:hypothetical protein